MVAEAIAWWRKLEATYSELVSRTKLLQKGREVVEWWNESWCCPKLIAIERLGPSR